MMEQLLAFKALVVVLLLAVYVATHLGVMTCVSAQYRDNVPRIDPTNGMGYLLGMTTVVPTFVTFVWT